MIALKPIYTFVSINGAFPDVQVAIPIGTTASHIPSEMQAFAQSS